MTNAQVTAAMPGIPLRPDTREIDRADHSISAFIGPFEIVFAASGELRSITAALPELQGGVRIGGHILGANSTPAAVISVLHGCRAAAPVGGGHITQCTGIDVMDLYTAERLRPSSCTADLGAHETSRPRKHGLVAESLSYPRDVPHHHVASRAVGRERALVDQSVACIARTRDLVAERFGGGALDRAHQRTRESLRAAERLFAPGEVFHLLGEPADVVVGGTRDGRFRRRQCSRRSNDLRSPADSRTR